MMTICVSLLLLALTAAHITLGSSPPCRNAVYNVQSLNQFIQNNTCQSGAASEGGETEDLKVKFAVLQTKMQALENRVKSLHCCHYTPRSCKEHMDNANGQPMVDGLYRILHSGRMLNVYCDMTTYGGGWMLLVSNTAGGRNWTLANIRERNIASAGLHIEYSILRIADEIRKKSSASYFEYRLEATGRGRWGGIWRAPAGYTLLDETASQTNITEITKFDNYRYHDTESIGYRVPWIDVKHPAALLTTRRFDPGNWWGTLAMKESASAAQWNSHGPAPWMASSYNSGGTSKSNVSPIYYWFRMD